MLSQRLETALSAPLRATALVALSSSLLLMGYEVLRSASNSLLKEALGLSALPIVMSLTPVLMIPCLMLYGMALRRCGPRMTLYGCSLVPALLLGLCYLALNFGYGWASVPLYLVREIYIVLLIEQFWSFINSVLTEQEARKVNGLVLGVGAIGAMTGGILVHALAQQIGTLNLVLLPIAIAAGVCLVMARAFRLAKPRGEKAARAKKASHDLLGLKLFRDPTLRTILWMILASQVFSTLVTLVLQEQLSDSYPLMDQQTAVSGLLFTILHGVSMTFQFVLAPLCLSRLPVRAILMGIPLVHLVMGCVFLVWPSLWTVGAVFIVFKSLDYSIFRASKETLYIPMSYEARYQAKEFIDVFGYRFGKSGTSACVSLLSGMGSVVSLGLMAGGIILAAAGWFFVATGLKPEGCAEAAVQKH